MPMRMLCAHACMLTLLTSQFLSVKAASSTVVLLTLTSWKPSAPETRDMMPLRMP